MKGKQNIISVIASGFLMLVLILDSKTALSGAAEGLDLCMRVIVPSLFPFFIVSTILTGLLSRIKIPLFRPLGKLLHLPNNAETLFIIGLLGGYPVGAQCIAQAYKAGNLSLRDAERMLAFCSNAGPAFIFGIGACIFQEAGICWLLWGIHILSALFVGLLTPIETLGSSSQIVHTPVSLTEAVNRSMNVLASVCGWIILFRIILAFLQRWFLWLLPKTIAIFFCGMVELANGSSILDRISSLGVRFTVFSVMLGFGGFCVVLQTQSVLAGSGLSARNYFPGKVTQAAISFLLCIIVAMLFPEKFGYKISITAVIAACVICLGYRMFLKKAKKEYSNTAISAV